ncbi:hypothetical protein [Actinacidiphila paucisporea]|uniref:Apea-like HEPN domain-containing protein n=1 Tax=Actinacidiphila paucisporea TaxID=310782 RepID=A0A1M6TH54_9ACTN|nr:hypothetical protein [Actinacidiphila paucisporea]SHK56253.1 hypothetical protein SAMN05216499_10143 [Actinacidiphila paucisporea]
MGTKSAFFFPERYWLLEEPAIEVRAFAPDEFFNEIKSWELSSGLEISVRGGGVLVFEFAKISSALLAVDEGPRHFPSLLLATQTRVTTINAFALCLHSARAEKENMGSEGFRVDHRDLFQLGEDMRAGIGGMGLMAVPMVPGAGYMRSFTKLGCLPESTFGHACETLDHITSSPFGKALELTALINDALASLKNHDFSSSLITAWTVCETLLQQNWVEYMTAQGSPSGLSSARKQKLTGRDFTASVVSEILALADLIDAETLSRMDKVRKARNAWMHSVKPPPYEDAIAALELATAMLSNTLERPIHIAPSISASGL